jgi:hypothetical protein
MATTNSVGNSLSGTSGAGSFVGRDHDSNISGNNFLPGFSTVVSAAGTTILTVASTQVLEITGTTTQTVQLPVVSTLALGTPFQIINNSTGAVTINSSGGNLVATLTAGSDVLLNTVLNTGTTAASWNVSSYSAGSGTVNSGTANQLAYYSAAGTAVSGVGPGNAGQLFQSAGSGSAPAYTTATYPGLATSTGTLLRADGTNWAASTSTFADTYAASTLLYANGANTVAGLATANSAALVTNATGVPIWSSTMTDGQIIIGSTGATPAAATLTAGSGISITNAAGSVTIGATGGVSVASIAGTTQTAAVNTKYFALNAGQTVVTLPSTYAVGDIVAVIGSTANTGGWRLQAASGDTIRYLNSTTSAGGTLTSSASAGSTVYIECDVANTSWVVSSTVNVTLTTA